MSLNKSGFKRYLFVFLFVYPFLLSDYAGAYYYETCGGNKVRWGSNSTTMYISTTSFPPGWSYTNRIEDAMRAWNNVMGSDFLFYVGRDTDGSHSNSNGKNEVYWVNEPGEDFVGKTKVKLRDCYWWFGWHYGIREADIEFNLKYSWINYNPSPWDIRDGGNPGKHIVLEGVALHELGHALGLSNRIHEDRRLATMNTKVPNGGTVAYNKEWTPLPNDRQGIRYLYPASTSSVDIAASAFTHGSDGKAGTIHNYWYAYPGDLVSIEYTVMNLGTETVSGYDIGFYLSEDEVIDPNEDIYLGRTVNAWIYPGDVYTYRRTVGIPYYLPPRVYYLGFKVDYNNKWSESSEENNCSASPQQIEIRAY